MDLKWVISDEERTRHDALFYSQKPRNRYLSGEQARSLFIRSKLPLPDLSKIWKLADVSRNNMLDISEFAVAMHLIQSRLKGTDIPEKLPETLIPIPVAWVEVPTILQVERKAYERAFSWMDKEKTGYIDAGTVCSILIESQLSKEILAKIWNLSDEDRDGKLSLNEFCVAIHLTRFCKKGNSLDGSVNVKSIVSQEWIEENFEGKKHRLAEVQTEKRKLLSLKEKLCHEIAGDVEEPAIAETIKTELNQVEKELYVLEKEENGLRRTLQQIKDKSKKESFKPFDRSFLLKRHASGEDIFRGTRKQNSASLANEEILEIEKLWSEDGDLADFGVTIEEPPSSPVNYSIRRDQFATVIELNQSQGSIETSATSSGAASPVANGISENEDKRDSIPLHVNNNCIEIDEKRVDVTDQTTTSSESHESETVQVSEEANSEDTENQLMNGSRLSDQQLITIDGPHSPLQQTETDFAPSDLSCTKDMNQNKTDDEKYSSQKLELKADYHNTQVKGGVGKVAFGEYVKGGETPLLLGSLNHRQIPVAESGNLIPTGSKSYLDTSLRVDNLLLQPSSGGGSIAVETRNEEGDMARASSPRSLTQEEFLPIFLEEKRKKDEERARQRQIDEEMRQQARRENYRRMQEEHKQAEQRKSVFQEERLRLEQQVSLAKEEQERRKSPVSRVEAGKLIEMELEEQRIREEITRMEQEKIKDKEKMEMEKQKLKQAKREEHPSTVLSKDVVQKTISDETNFLETEPFQSLSSRIAGKRGSVIDLSENEGPSSKLEQRPAETKERVYMQPVVRRTPENSWPIASRKDENRKSVVELEIERQKEREEEARREAKNVRRILAQRSSDSLTYQSATDVDGERHRGLENSTVPPPVRKEIIETDNIVGGKPVLRKQMEVETIPQQRTLAMLESPPLDEIDAPLNRNGDELAETTQEETKEEARRKELELFRQMQEEEKRRRGAEKQELDRLKKEVERREAEELMRLKLAREEERSRKREAELKEAAKREKEEEQRHAEQNQAATSRKASFAAHKLILEQRVLKALEETKQEANISKKRSSSLDRPSEFFDQVQTQPSMPVSETSEDVSSACVKLRKACFERPAAQTESREEMRNKRYSLNLDQARRATIAREDGASCSKHPARSAGQKNQLSYYPDDIVTRESKTQLEREEELLRRVGGKPRVGEGKLAKARSLGDLSRSVDQQDGPMSYQIVRDIPLNGDVTDSGSVPEDGLPVFADVRIRKELQEQRMREEILRKEALEREKRYRLVDEKKKQMEGPSLVGKKDVSLRDIKKNPLPNKIVVKKPQPSSNRDSLTQSMASHWENVLQNQDGNSVTEKKEKKASFIELEKEEERRREEELQRERERGLLEKKKNEEEKELARQRKIQEELEKKRKAKEEKEKRQQRTLAMKSIFEKMGSKK